MRRLRRASRRAALLAVIVACSSGQAPLGPGSAWAPLGPSGGQGGNPALTGILLIDPAVNLLTDSAGNLLTQ